MKNIIILVVLLLISPVSSLNYLVFCPLYAHSHHTFLAKIADTLSEAGHNVTFLAPIILRKYENVKYLSSTKDIAYLQPSKKLESLGFSADYSKFWSEDATAIQFVPAIRAFTKMFEQLYWDLKADLSVLDELKSRKFDALVFEFLCPVGFPIAEYLGVKALLPSLSMTHHPLMSRLIGEPSSPAVLPSMISSFGDDMNFWERLQNTIGDLFFTFFVHFPIMPSFNDPEKLIDFREMTVRSPFMFMNSNPYLDYPRPLLTKTVLIGGISINSTRMKQEKLSEKYDSILSKNEKNVLISFGVTFLWKYEEDNTNFAKNLPNLHFSKWLPQTALLADPRLTAFITHAGLGSVTELSYLGKPAVVIPIFADQLRNSKTLARHNGSITLSKYDLSNFEKLRTAIDSILNEKRFD
uniref:glucuronosyltransferase n=1 Tax=Caenorhabditis tropicalis TaxID=1561998 RepID=A0A1I7U701_9PELO